MRSSVLLSLTILTPSQASKGNTVCGPQLTIPPMPGEATLDFLLSKANFTAGLLSNPAFL